MQQSGVSDVESQSAVVTHTSSSGGKPATVDAEPEVAAGAGGADDPELARAASFVGSGVVLISLLQATRIVIEAKISVRDMADSLTEWAQGRLRSRGREGRRHRTPVADIRDISIP